MSDISKKRIWQRFWVDENITQEELRKSVSESNYMSQKLIFAIRTVIAIFMIVVEFQISFLYTDYLFPILLKYLTQQSAYYVMCYYICVTLDSILLLKNKNNKWCISLWKGAVYFYEIAFITQPGLVLMFWIVLLPKNPGFWDFTTHGVFLIFILFEFVVNKIQLQKKHWPLIVATILVFLFINMIVSLAHKPVYDVTTYKDVMTYVYILVLALMFFLTFLLGFLLQKKLRKQSNLDQTQGNTQQKPDQQNIQIENQPAQDIENNNDKQQQQEITEQNQPALQN